MVDEERKEISEEIHIWNSVVSILLRKRNGEVRTKFGVGTKGLNVEIDELEQRIQAQE